MMEVYAGEDYIKNAKGGYSQTRQPIPRKPTDWMTVFLGVMALCSVLTVAINICILTVATTRAVDRPSSVLSSDYQKGAMEMQAKSMRYIDNFYGSEASARYYKWLKEGSR